MGPQLLATLCVALSVVLFARGNADPTGGFCLQTLSCWQDHNNLGAQFRYNCHILRCKVMFTAPIYCVYKGPPLCLLICYVVGL
jgi:hypothetical protein